MTGRSSIALVACFCSPAKSCSYVLISLTRTCFSIIPQRGHSNLAPLFKPPDHPHRGWMMWNFLIGGLGICRIVLYDGSPLKQPSYLWNLVDELGITIFGTSAKYLDELSVRPPPISILSTVNPLYCSECTNRESTTNSQLCVISILRALLFRMHCLTTFTNTSRKRSC